VAANRTDTLAAASQGTVRLMEPYQQEDMTQSSVGTPKEVWYRGDIRFLQEKEREEEDTSLQAVGSQGRLWNNHQPNPQGVSLP
jgi:hypothetical protein